MVMRDTLCARRSKTLASNLLTHSLSLVYIQCVYLVVFTVHARAPRPLHLVLFHLSMFHGHWHLLFTYMIGTRSPSEQHTYITYLQHIACTLNVLWALAHTCEHSLSVCDDWRDRSCIVQDFGVVLCLFTLFFSVSHFRSCRSFSVRQYYFFLYFSRKKMKNRKHSKHCWCAQTWCVAKEKMIIFPNMDKSNWFMNFKWNEYENVIFDRCSERATMSNSRQQRQQRQNQMPSKTIWVSSALWFIFAWVYGASVWVWVWAVVKRSLPYTRRYRSRKCMHVKRAARTHKCVWAYVNYYCDAYMQLILNAIRDE